MHIHHRSSQNPFGAPLNVDSGVFRFRGFWDPEKSSATAPAQKLIHGLFFPKFFFILPFSYKLMAFAEGLSVRELRTRERASTEGTRVGARRGFDFTARIWAQISTKNGVDFAPETLGGGFSCFNISSSFLSSPFSALFFFSLCSLTFSSQKMAHPMRC